MKGSDIQREDFLRMLYELTSEQRQFARWVMTEEDWEQVCDRFPVERPFPFKDRSLFAKPVHLDETAEGITFEPGPPPLPGVLLQDGDILQYRHCGDPRCPSAREGYSHAHRVGSEDGRVA